MVGQLLQKIPAITGLTPKAIAKDTGISVDAWYKAVKDERKIPSEARQKLSGTHLIGGLAAALEATKYWVFNYLNCDRHPHSLIQRNIREDREADEAVDKLNFLLLDANGPEDLTEETRGAILLAIDEIFERIQCDFNLVLELDAKYHLGVSELLQKKKEQSTRREARCSV